MKVDSVGPACALLIASVSLFACTYMVAFSRFADVQPVQCGEATCFVLSDDSTRQFASELEALSALEEHAVPVTMRTVLLWLLSTLVLCLPCCFCGGLLMLGVSPESFGASPRALPLVAVAGALVGVGTRLGNGCTSGHGVCGLSRLSVRSLAATLTFMTTGFLAATATRFFFGGA